MIEAAPKQNILSKWLIWHYVEVPKYLLSALGNFLVFNMHYFSIPLLFRTLFSHWRRYRDFYGQGFEPKRAVEVFIYNTISRALGAIVRIITMLIGLLVELVIFILGVLIFLSWLFLPLIIFMVVFSGFGPLSRTF